MGRGAFLPEDIFHGSDEGRSGHHHAGTSTIGGIVSRPVTIGRPVTNVVDVNLHQSPLARSSQDAEVERSRKHRWEEREDVEADARGART